MNTGLLVALLGLSILGCKDNSTVGGPFRELAVIRSSKNFEIPRDLKLKIEKNYIDFFRSEDPTDITTDEKLVEKIPREFLEIDVYFSQEQKGALEQDFVMRSPRGGGLIDLTGLVKGEKGSFFVRFGVKIPGEENGDNLKGFQVYYLSGSKKRNIADEIYGADCGTLVDVTATILKSGIGRGLRVNATDDRYFSTLVGDYFFVSYAREKIYLAAVTLDDSSVNLPRCEKQMKVTE